MWKWVVIVVVLIVLLVLVVGFFIGYFVLKVSVSGRKNVYDVSGRKDVYDNFEDEVSVMKMEEEFRCE